VAEPERLKPAPEPMADVDRDHDHSRNVKQGPETEFGKGAGEDREIIDRHLVDKTEPNEMKDDENKDERTAVGSSPRSDRSASALLSTA